MQLIYLAKALSILAIFLDVIELVRTTGTVVVVMNVFLILQKTSSGLYYPSLDANVNTTGLYTLPDWNQNV